MTSEQNRVASSSARPPLRSTASKRAPDESSLLLLPSHDNNNWYFPSQGHDSDEDLMNYGISRGNWGKKKAKASRWVRTGKLAAWGPGHEDWGYEEQARKRMKLVAPQEISRPLTPKLPHLRSPSPPASAPYPTPATQHLTYSSFVLDQAVTHSFRSDLLNDLERATNGLIEGEAAMRRALGKLWQVMSEDPDIKWDDVPRLPDLTPPVHKLFLKPYTNGAIPSSHFSVPEMQQENLEKSLAALRELQDDGREYVERLEEIREGLGTVRAQRDGVWEMVRERAIAELEDVAAGYS